MNKLLNDLWIQVHLLQPETLDRSSCRRLTDLELSVYALESEVNILQNKYVKALEKLNNIK